MIPNFDNIKVVDGEGLYTAEWKNIITTLFSSLRGYSTTHDTAANIANYDMTKVQNGKIVYDTTNNVAKICINGVLKTIQTL